MNLFEYREAMLMSHFLIFVFFVWTVTEWT